MSENRCLDLDRPKTERRTSTSGCGEVPESVGYTSEAPSTDLFMDLLSKSGTIWPFCVICPSHSLPLRAASRRAAGFVAAGVRVAFRVAPVQPPYAELACSLRTEVRDGASPRRVDPRPARPATETRIQGSDRCVVSAPRLLLRPTEHRAAERGRDEGTRDGLGAGFSMFGGEGVDFGTGRESELVKMETP